MSPSLTVSLQNRSPFRRQAPRPNCTHIDMDRIFGPHQCQICMQYPSIGWVYVCRQDERFPESFPSLDSILNQHPSTAELSLRDQLKSMGLSESVVETAEHGDYTADQLDKLKVQKLRLYQVISAAIHGRNGSPCSTPTKKSVRTGTNTGSLRKDSGSCASLPTPPKNLIFRSTPENNPPNNDGAGAEDTPLADVDPNARKIVSTTILSTLPDSPLITLKSKTEIPPPCSMKVCHHCRPYYKDRIYLSFGAVFADEVAPVTPQEATGLRVSSVETVRNLGLRHAPQLRLLTDEDGEILASSDSQYTIHTTQSDREHLRLVRQGPRNFYKVNSNSSAELKREFQKIGWRDSLKYAFHNVFKPGRESSSEGSSITLPLPRTGRHRGGWTDATDEFDLRSLKRVRSHRRLTLEREHDSSQDTSGGLTTDGSEDHIDVSSSSSGYSEYSSLSEGSEVEVDGGVALTEESGEAYP